jgi:hypothetical protein
MGDSKVRPWVDAVLQRDEKMDAGFKGYHFGGDGEKRTPLGQVECGVGANELFQVPEASPGQVT